MLDIGCSMLALVCFPIGLFFVRRPLGLLMNLVDVLLGAKSWVGLSNASERDSRSRIRPGVLTPVDAVAVSDRETARRLDTLYARDYSVKKDLKILVKAYVNLGRRSTPSL